MFDLLPARFSCSTDFNIFYNSLGLSEKKMVLNPNASIVLLLKKIFMRFLSLKIYLENVYEKAFHSYYR